MQQYYCVCLPGYAGDGYNCTLDIQPTTEADGRTLQICRQGICWCPTGYAAERDSNYCAPIEIITETVSEASTIGEGKSFSFVEEFCHNRHFSSGSFTGSTMLQQ